MITLEQVQAQIAPVVTAAQTAQAHGLDFQYALLCSTRLWLHRRYVDWAHLHPAMLDGLALHQSAYPRLSRIPWDFGIPLDGVNWNRATVIEIKRRNSRLPATRAQVLYYMAVLTWHTDRLWQGEVRIPDSRRRWPLHWTASTLQELEQAWARAQPWLSPAVPMPPPQRQPLCRQCSYNRLCWELPFESGK